MSGSRAMMVPWVGAVMRAVGAAPDFKPFWPPALVDIARAAPESIANVACCVPSTNHSVRAASRLGVLLAGANCTVFCTRPVGGLGARLACLACKKFITAAQMGAAPVVPLTSHMGAPLALPTHTPTV